MEATYTLDRAQSIKLADWLSSAPGELKIVVTDSQIEFKHSSFSLMIDNPD